MPLPLQMFLQQQQGGDRGGNRGNILQQARQKRGQGFRPDYGMIGQTLLGGLGPAGAALGAGIGSKMGGRTTGRSVGRGIGTGLGWAFGGPVGGMLGGYLGSQVGGAGAVPVGPGKEYSKAELRAGAREANQRDRVPIGGGRTASRSELRAGARTANRARRERGDYG